METFAQTVKLRVVPISPGKLAAIGKSSLMATTGLKVFGKGEKAYLLADTTGSGATVVTSFTWTFVSKPTASNAVFDSAANNQNQSFTADSTGQYVVSVSVSGGATSQDTFWVSTYIGSVRRIFFVRDMPCRTYSYSCNGMAIYSPCEYVYAGDYGGTGSQRVRSESIRRVLEMPHDGL